MDPSRIQAHWQDWAARYGTALRATTKSGNAKRLEVDALARALGRAGLGEVEGGEVLEVGCGNAHNLIELGRRFPRLRLTGVDFAPAMVAMARRNAEASGQSDRITCLAGDALELDSLAELRPEYAAVFTDRCLINLPSVERQKRAIDQLVAKLAPGGTLLLLENSRQTHAAQNACRERLGLEPRPVASFNHFLDEAEIRPHLEARVELLRVEDFGSLHDLLLYVLVPATNGGRVDYDHPLVRAATDLCLALPEQERAALGAFGQNRLFVCRRRELPG